MNMMISYQELVRTFPKLLHHKLPNIIHKFNPCESVAEMLPSDNIRSIDNLSRAQNSPKVYTDGNHLRR